ncbi:MAG: phage capsid protein [Pseudomonadota bacterium]
MSKDIKVQPHHVQTYANSFELKLQQMNSKLRRYVREKPCEGEGAVAADLIGEINYQRGSGRRRSNIENTPDRERRWHVYPDPIETGDYLDSVDRFRQTTNPESALMRTHVAAIRRGFDDTILGVDLSGKVTMGGVMGKVSQGKVVGQSSPGLPSSQIIAHGSTGLTIAKLREARKKFADAEIDLELMQPVMAISPDEHDDLLGVVEGASANLNMLEQPHIVNGRVKRLMGFDFVEITRLPTTANVRDCPVWLPDYVELGLWQDVKPDMWNDSHARNTPYAHVDAFIDCVRTQDEGVVVIKTQR